jgi:putative membrane protein
MPTTKADAGSSDTFIQNVAIADMFGGATAKLALSKSSNAAVQNFARRLVQEYSASSDQLRELIHKGKLNIVLPTEVDQQHQTILQNLNGYSGTAFDRAFIQSQRESQQKTLAFVRQYAEDGHDERLKAFAASLAKTLEADLVESQRLS